MHHGKTKGLEGKWAEKTAQEIGKLMVEGRRRSNGDWLQRQEHTL